ncbi:MAG TPA: hydrogenase 3 maturation endopeptidase HyCI [bacterium]|nr:hydrogenase 3 maturation endopeptidase HyCI [bacterium]
MKNIKKRLKERLKGKIVIVGVGNILKRDDGLGPYLIKRLRGKVRTHLIDGGSAPENYVGKIASLKPDTILVIDACNLGWAPGGIGLLEIEKMKHTGYSTHNTSPGVFMTYLKEETGADVFMLAIQPREVRLGEGLSSPVKRAIEKVEEWLRENA